MGLEVLANFSIILFSYKQYVYLTSFQFFLSVLFYILIYIKLKSISIYIIIGGISSFIKGINSINLITALFEENIIEYNNKEVGFVM